MGLRDAYAALGLLLEYRAGPTAEYLLEEARENLQVGKQNRSESLLLADVIHFENYLDQVRSRSCDSSGKVLQWPNLGGVRDIGERADLPAAMGQDLEQDPTHAARSFLSGRAMEVLCVAGLVAPPFLSALGGDAQLATMQAQAGAVVAGIVAVASLWHDRRSA
jgi:hypothetical protein